MPVRDLTEACDELLTQLEVFGLVPVDIDRASAGLVMLTCLSVEPDTVPGLRRTGSLESRPPWNSQSANAYLDAHQLVRRLEASMRLYVAGHTGRMRGGSDLNTREAIRAISKMSTAVPPRMAARAAQLITRVTTTIGQLPAVDEFPKWERIRPGPDGLPPRCPNCETFSLRVAIQSGQVCCFFPGCEDLDGNKPPQARLDMSKLNGEPVLAWRDGTVQAAPGST